MKTKILFSLLSVGLSLRSFAYCPNTTFCVYPTPLLNQMSTQIPSAWFPGGDPASSQLCVPTATTMAFEGMLKYGVSGTEIKPTGWLQNNFWAPGTSYDRVVRTSQKMHTEVANGTYGNWTVAVLDEMGKSLVYKIPFLGIEVPMAQVANLGVGQINFANMMNTFQKGHTAAVTTHGHYTRVPTYIATPTLNSITYNYTRNGGHAINPKGHIGDVVVYNDPSGALLRFSKIRTDSSYVQQSGINKKQNILPGGGTASMYAILQSANYYPLLETFGTASIPTK